ncbi:MAG TPA: AAA family ATPase [Bryobacteraceae bacterium]|nr:AAA family ATPase [Bryobacteraceae bacterium]
MRLMALGLERGNGMSRMNKHLDPTLTGTEATKLDADLRKRIVGQDDAVDQIVNIYQTFLAGMSSPGRPIGNFLFLGPTGSGKTRLVEATAESLVGDMHAVIKIDCAEFQHSHEIAKLIGSPPGYLGHRETHPLLSQEVLQQYYTDRIKLSFVLFDEIEKASDALWNLLLGILDKATLTLGDNRRVDFSRALIFMTSNLGAGEMSSILRPNLGFAASEMERKCAEGLVDGSLTDKISRAGVEAARRKFTPEFMNRLDKVVVFRPLGECELRQILGIELHMLQQRIFHSANGSPFLFTLTDAAKEFLLREGTDMKYGARHLKRAIDRSLVHPLSNLIATEQVRGGDLVKVDFDDESDQMTFFREAEDMPPYTMMQMMDAPPAVPAGVLATGASVETPRTTNAKSSRR